MGINVKYIQIWLVKQQKSQKNFFIPQVCGMFCQPLYTVFKIWSIFQKMCGPIKYELGLGVCVTFIT